MAVIAAAGKMGISSDELCAQAVGGLMADHYWSWADARYANGAADEIDNALSVLVGRQMARPMLSEPIDPVPQSPTQVSV
jgi:hypothetical protein